MWPFNKRDIAEHKRVFLDSKMMLQTLRADLKLMDLSHQVTGSCPMCNGQTCERRETMRQTLKVHEVDHAYLESYWKEFGHLPRMTDLPSQRR